MAPPSSEDDDLHTLLGNASHRDPGPRFADSVIDLSYSSPQLKHRFRGTVAVALPLSGAAALALALSPAPFGRPVQDPLLAEESIADILPEAGVTISEIDAVEFLLTLESSSDVRLVGDDEIEALLF